jgi:hypothetical protein
VEETGFGGVRPGKGKGWADSKIKLISDIA